MPKRRVSVVRSAYGGVLGELGSWLAAELAGNGADATVCDASAAGLADADLVVLLGAGQEFEPALRRRPTGRTVLWALDPLPPPGLPSEALAAGLRHGRRLTAMRRLERGLPLGLGSPGSFAAPRRLARTVARRIAGAGDSPTDGAHGIDAGFAFSRLGWLEAAVARGRLDRILVSSPASVATLAERGITAEYQPVLPHAAMGCDLGLPRDVPVLFLGSAIDGRGPRVAALAEALDARGTKLTVVDRGCFGQERTALLNRTKVVVNLHKFPWHLERIRLLLATVNGALFLTEHPVPSPEPFVVGRDLAAAPAEGLADAIAAHLPPSPREELVRSAQAVTATLPDLGSVARSLLGAA